MTLWFGEPWPSAELRAPVCEYESDHVRTPVGQSCLFCEQSIILGDRGIVVAQLNPGPSMTGAIHLDCLLPRIGIGEAMQAAANAVRAEVDLPPLDPPNPITGFQRRDCAGGDT